MISTLKTSTAISLATGQGDLGKMKLLLVDIQSGLTRAAAYASPKLFQVRRSLGEKELVKLLVFTLKAFQDSLKVKEGMEAADLIECAQMVLAKYSHDSLKDIMLALKEAKWNGRVFYNALSGPVVMDILAEYFDAKALELEAEHRQQKAQPAPDMLGQLPPEVAQQFVATVQQAAPVFDEEAYQREKLAWLDRRTQERNALEEAQKVAQQQLPETPAA